jgi:hypothetical protein
MRPWKTKRLAMAAIIVAASAATAWGQQFTIAPHSGEIVGRNGLEVYIKSNVGIAVIADLKPERSINGMRLAGKIPDPHVEVTGEIRGEHLTKGMYVRFTTKVQGKSRPRTVEPVKLMEVFTPDALTKFGLFDEGVVGGGDEGANGDAVREARVVGVITSLRGSTMGVAFPRSNTKGSLNAKVADDAVINVKVNQLIAPNGAQVSLEGYQLQGVAQQPIRVLVTRLQIQLPPPPPPTSKVAARPAGKDKDDKPGEGGFGSPDGKEAGEDEVAADGIKAPGKILWVN